MTRFMSLVQVWVLMLLDLSAIILKYVQIEGVRGNFALAKKSLLVKNLQFFFYLHETWSK